MDNKIITGLLIAGVVESFIFSILFLIKKEKKIFDKIVAIWLLVLAIQTIFIAISINDKTITYTIKQIQTSILLLHGPFLYLYTDKLINKNTKFKVKNFLHLVPFFICIAIALLFYLLHIQNESFLKTIVLSGIISGLIYNSIVLNKLLWHKKQIQNDFSYTEKINLNWLMKLSFGLFIIWTVGSVSGIMLHFFNYQIPIEGIFLFVPVFVFYLGFHGIKQQFISSHENSKKQPILNKKLTITQQPETQIDTRYKKSGLQHFQMEKISKALEQLIRNEKLYLNPQFTLSNLSEKTNIPAHYITQTLNEYGKQNFHDFVNFYRVEEFKAQILLPKNESFSLLGIALDCGFNSKSSFNRIFKKITSQTPSEYKKKIVDK